MKNSTRFLNQIILFFLTINLIFAVIAAVFTPISAIFSIATSEGPFLDQLLSRTSLTREEFDEMSPDTQRFILKDIEIPMTNRLITDGLTVITMILLPGLYVFISYEIYKFFKRMDQGKPFSRENGIRLRMIGIAFVVGTVWFSIINEIVIPFVSRGYTPLEYAEMREFNGFFTSFSWAIVGLMFMVIGEAFVQGSKLEEENKLTV